MDVSDTIKIRAHHLLCMQGFQGYGYSQNFITNMAQVIKDLKSPNQQIEIISECDVICSHCPHKKKGVCENNPGSAVKLENMDRQILKKLGLRKGERIKARDILTTIKTKLKTYDIKYVHRKV